MNDHDHNTTALDSQELTSKLNRIKHHGPIFEYGDSQSRCPRKSEYGKTTSSDTSSITAVSHLPSFRRADTSSTLDNNSVSRLEVVRTIPSSTMSMESAEVLPGEFSKPRLPRWREESREQEKPKKEFQYYGRHANSWLFNDFSVTDTVKKGWGKLVSTKEELSEKNEKDE